MKIVEINMTNTGSTGKIMLQIAKCARESGHYVSTFSAKVYSRKPQKLPVASDGHHYFGTFFENAIHTILAQFTGYNGWYSYFGTKKLIRELKKIKPDIIHLHNLHSFCINFPILFRYINKNNIKTVWTLHDCWPFTGHCPHFSIASCDKWQNDCHNCPQLNIYPKTRVNNTRRAFLRKRKLFTTARNMTIVTPSKWLAKLVNKSFLNAYRVTVINNGIDLNIFKPRQSSFREKHGIDKNAKIILGVAFDWSERKGLDIFVKLAKYLSNEYKIVLVGTNDIIDEALPDNVISIHKTQNQIELTEIYTAADLFFNPTREDTYPTVNMEALACGTPVLTLNTGGSPEIIDSTCGAVITNDNIDIVKQSIIQICSHPFNTAACLERAKNFDMNRRFEEYVRLYEDITRST